MNEHAMSFIQRFFKCLVVGGMSAVLAGCLANLFLPEEEQYGRNGKTWQPFGSSENTRAVFSAIEQSTVAAGIAKQQRERDEAARKLHEQQQQMLEQQRLNQLREAEKAARVDRQEQQMKGQRQATADLQRQLNERMTQTQVQQPVVRENAPTPSPAPIAQPDVAIRVEGFFRNGVFYARNTSAVPVRCQMSGEVSPSVGIGPFRGTLEHVQRSLLIRAHSEDTIFTGPAANPRVFDCSPGK